ncbi:MAG: UbiA family prenyltransferase [Phycisphaerales bacterium]|nr:UbiA family prenyltransferase [Phycisphaerales bacterium]
MPAETAPAPTTPPPPRSALHIARAVAGDIKIAHSVFALPFALLAVFLSRSETESPATLGAKAAIVVACMFFARTWAMLVNRFADRRIDARNPRTARRALPSGRLAPGQAAQAMLVCAAAFLLLAGLFGLLFANWWPAILALPVLVWIAFYSFTKRFTALCHLFLGGALAASPLCAAIAVRPHALADTPALWWLAAMVLCWVAGFGRDLRPPRPRLRSPLRSLEHPRRPRPPRCRHGEPSPPRACRRLADPRLACRATLRGPLRSRDRPHDHPPHHRACRPHPPRPRRPRPRLLHPQRGRELPPRPPRDRRPAPLAHPPTPSLRLSVSSSLRLSFNHS